MHSILRMKLSIIAATMALVALALPGSEAEDETGCGSITHTYTSAKAECTKHLKKSRKIKKMKYYFLP